MLSVFICLSIFVIIRKIPMRFLSRLMSRRRDKDVSVSAGFHRNPRSLDTFGAAPDDTTNAYILWSLSHAGLRIGLDQQIEALFSAVLGSDRTSKDPYIMGLAAATCFNLHRLGISLPLTLHGLFNGTFHHLGIRLARSLIEWQCKATGMLTKLPEDVTSITSSQGDSLLMYRF